MNVNKRLSVKIDSIFDVPKNKTESEKQENDRLRKIEKSHKVIEKEKSHPMDED
jgi:hypothetical protein